MTAADAADAGRMAEALDDAAPDLLILRTPNPAALAWARRRRRRALPIFADFFANDGAKALWRNLRLRALLASPLFPCVANHSLNAARSVARVLRYPRRRIVPWDWSRLEVAPETPRPAGDPRAPALFYAGALKEAKGVGDLLEAVRLLRAQGLAPRLTVAGGGDGLEAWRARAAALGLDDGAVVFAGRLPHAEVRARMAASDMVVVPSRRDYAEGLPNTIYEALAARAALVLSDHPAFVGRLEDGASALFHRAGDAAHLAGRIATLASDPALAARLRAAAPSAHDRLYVGMAWSGLVSAFLDDPRDEGGWVARNALAALDP